LVSPRLFCTLQVHGSLDIWNVNIEFKWDWRRCVKAPCCWSKTKS
jgi:hypothetical protein